MVSMVGSEDSTEIGMFGIFDTKKGEYLYKINRKNELCYTLLDFIVHAKSPNIANVLTTYEDKLYAIQIDLFKES